MRGGLGRRQAPDARDARFPMQAVLPAAASIRRRRYWNENGWWGDQGATSECVAYAWTHWIEDGPVTHAGPAPVVTPDVLYAEAQKVDEWPGEGYDGTSVRAGAKVLQARGWISAYHWAGGLGDVLAALLEAGPVVAGVNWYECVVPGTRVLTAGLDWVPVEKLNPGDLVVGFDESLGLGSRFRRATVLSTERALRSCRHIATDRGAIVTSDNHLFVRTHPKKRQEWARADALTAGDRLAFFGDPWESDRSWEAGWLAGFADGEGSLAGYDPSGKKRNVNLLQISQLPGPTWDRLCGYLTAKGFSFGVVVNKTTGVRHCYLRGENVKVRFLGSIKPGRLQSDRAWLDHPIYKKRVRPATVQVVEAIGEQEVVAVGTSTGTLITEGYLSHNSMFDPDPAGQVHADGAIAGGHAFVLNGVNLDTRLIRFKNSWGHGWGINGHAFLGFDDLTRLLAEDGEACLAVEVKR